MPEITLYYADGACSLAPHAVLNELAIPHKTVLIRYVSQASAPADGSLTAEEYRKIHHSNYVPALKVDDEIITENLAILTYLASLAPERNLVGKTDLEKVRVAEWMSYLSGTLHGWGYGLFFAPSRFVDDESLYEAARQKGRAKITSVYEKIEERLKGKSFAVGETATVADFYLIVFYYWGIKNDFEMGRYPGYGQLVKTMETKESVRETLRQEGQKLAFA